MANKKKNNAVRKRKAKDEVTGIFENEARDDSLVRDVLNNFNNPQSREKFPNWVRNQIANCREKIKELTPFADGKMSKLVLYRLAKELAAIELILNQVEANTPKEDEMPFNFGIVTTVTLYYEPLFNRMLVIRDQLTFLSLNCLGFKIKKRVAQPTSAESTVQQSTVPQPVQGKDEFEFDMYH